MKTKNPQQTISATGACVSYTTLTPRSHLILKAYKFRIYPNMAQRILLAKHFGCCRFAYNHFLSERNKAFKDENRKIGLFETHHMIAMMRQTEEYGWLKEVYGHSLQYSLRCLEVAFKNYFKKVTLYFYRHRLIKQLNDIYILIHFTKMHNTFHLFQYINTQVFLY